MYVAAVAMVLLLTSNEPRRVFVGRQPSDTDESPQHIARSVGSRRMACDSYAGARVEGSALLPRQTHRNVASWPFVIPLLRFALAEDELCPTGDGTFMITLMPNSDKTFRNCGSFGSVEATVLLTNGPTSAPIRFAIIGGAVARGMLVEGFSPAMAAASGPFNLTVSGVQFFLSSPLSIIGAYPDGSHITISGNTFEGLGVVTAAAANPAAVNYIGQTHFCIRIAPTAFGDALLALGAGVRFTIASNAVSQLFTSPNSRTGAAANARNVFVWLHARGLYLGRSSGYANYTYTPLPAHPLFFSEDADGDAVAAQLFIGGSGATGPLTNVDSTVSSGGVTVTESHVILIDLAKGGDGASFVVSGGSALLIETNKGNKITAFNTVRCVTIAVNSSIFAAVGVVGSPFGVPSPGGMVVSGRYSSLTVSAAKLTGPVSGTDAAALGIVVFGGGGAVALGAAGGPGIIVERGGAIRISDVTSAYGELYNPTASPTPSTAAFAVTIVAPRMWVVGGGPTDSSIAHMYGGDGTSLNVCGGSDGASSHFNSTSNNNGSSFLVDRCVLYGAESTAHTAVRVALGGLCVAGGARVNFTGNSAEHPAPLGVAPLSTPTFFRAVSIMCNAVGVSGGEGGGSSAVDPIAGSVCVAGRGSALLVAASIATNIMEMQFEEHDAVVLYTTAFVNVTGYGAVLSLSQSLLRSITLTNAFTTASSAARLVALSGAPIFVSGGAALELVGNVAEFVALPVSGFQPSIEHSVAAVRLYAARVIAVAEEGSGALILIAFNAVRSATGLLSVSAVAIKVSVVEVVSWPAVEGVNSNIGENFGKCGEDIPLSSFVTARPSPPPSSSALVELFTLDTRTSNSGSDGYSQPQQQRLCAEGLRGLAASSSPSASLPHFSSGALVIINNNTITSSTANAHERSVFVDASCVAAVAGPRAVFSVALNSVTGADGDGYNPLNGSFRPTVAVAAAAVLFAESISFTVSNGGLVSISSNGVSGMAVANKAHLYAVAAEGALALVADGRGNNSISNKNTSINNHNNGACMHIAASAIAFVGNYARDTALGNESSVMAVNIPHATTLVGTAGGRHLFLRNEVRTVSGGGNAAAAARGSLVGVVNIRVDPTPLAPHRRRGIGLSGAGSALLLENNVIILNSSAISNPPANMNSYGNPAFADFYEAAAVNGVSGVLTINDATVVYFFSSDAVRVTGGAALSLSGNALLGTARAEAEAAYFLPRNYENDNGGSCGSNSSFSNGSDNSSSILWSLYGPTDPPIGVFVGRVAVLETANADGAGPALTVSNGSAAVFRGNAVVGISAANRSAGGTSYCQSSSLSFGQGVAVAGGEASGGHAYGNTRLLVEANSIAHTIGFPTVAVASVQISAGGGGGGSPNPQGDDDDILLATAACRGAERNGGVVIAGVGALLSVGACCRGPWGNAHCGFLHSLRHWRPLRPRRWRSSWRWHL